MSEFADWVAGLSAGVFFGGAAVVLAVVLGLVWVVEKVGGRDHRKGNKVEDRDSDRSEGEVDSDRVEADCDGEEKVGLDRRGEEYGDEDHESHPGFGVAQPAKVAEVDGDHEDRDDLREDGGGLGCHRSTLCGCCGLHDMNLREELVAVLRDLRTG